MPQLQQLLVAAGLFRKSFRQTSGSCVHHPILRRGGAVAGSVSQYIGRRLTIV